MDRRSWLWRRRTSDKGPDETDSSGSGSGSGLGSISSPSERFSDEHQPYSSPNEQSPEITSKVASHDEDVNGSLKILTEKLSDALASVDLKEELVKQHAKVAEEAVTGWEKAEEEVITLKQQLEVATTKNNSLEERVHHLDGALKECLRQSRQVKEEYDHKIQEVFSKKSQDTYSQNPEFENQLSDLRAQLETAKAEAEATTSSEFDLRLRLDSIMKENGSLKLELRSRLQNLEIRTLERDLSTRTAETASKQHLESIKKVAKLEAECRRLRNVASKATSFSEKKSFFATPSRVSSHTERCTDAISIKTGLMDDFLEIERLAALPVVKLNGIGDDSLRAEFEAMMKRTVELEEKVKTLESEKIELFKMSEARMIQPQSKLSECQNQLKISQAQLRDANKNLGMLQAELDLSNELKQAIELELEDANLSREEARSELRAIGEEIEILLSKVVSLESEAELERSLYAEASSKCRVLEDELSRMKHENVERETIELQLEDAQSEIKSLMAKCRKLEDGLSRMKHEAETWKTRLDFVNGSKQTVEIELKMVNARRQEVESQLEVARDEAKSLLVKVCSLEHEAKEERDLSAEFAAKCKTLENELSKMKSEADLCLVPRSNEELNTLQEKEMAISATKLAECQKTIASLGQRLKTLASFDDLFSTQIS